jgi:GDP-L-fucose synthase
MLFDLTDKRVWIAGQHGMVGSAMMRRLEREGCDLLRDSGRAGVDLRRQSAVEDWIASQRPQVVVLTAGRVGGLCANDTFPADFLYDNLLIEANIIRAAYQTGVDKLLFFGSSCIYPREAPQPIPEEALLTGPLERTNEAYAIAKIAGVKLCQAYRRQHGCDFISAMPTNLYGPGDNFHPETGHVPAALLRRFHEAKLAGAREVVVWGSGTPRREFLMSTISPTRAFTFCGTIPVTRISMSARVTTSRSQSSPSTLSAAWTSKGGSCTIGRDRTERHASSSTAVASKRWAGKPPPRSRRA